MLTRILLLLLIQTVGFLLIAQPENDNCSNAQELCSGTIYSGTTKDATVEQCFTTSPNGCADDNGSPSFCFVPLATVWYKFTTNSVGGSVTVDFTNLNIDPDPTLGRKLHAVMVRSTSPCEGGNYTYVSQCFNNGIVDFSLTSNVALLPNTEYYIQVDGAGLGPGVLAPAEIDFDIAISGPGIEVLPMSVTISASETTLCQFDQVPISFSLANCTNNPRFEWVFNGALVGDSAVFQTSVLTQSGYLYLKASCGYEGCPNSDNSDSIFFDVTPLNADAGPDQLVEVGETIIFAGSGIGVPSWTPAMNLTNPNTFTPSIQIEESNIYFLTTTNGDCSITDEVVISLKSPLNIPNGFTPNGDNNNDFWEIEFIDQYQDNQVIVYDRSGQVVYRTVGYNNGTTAWDGTYKGNPVPVSTYYYVIDLRNGGDNSVFKGPVTIIR